MNENQFLERLINELSKTRITAHGTEFIPADSINEHIVINGTQVDKTHTKEYLVRAKKFLQSGLYANTAVAVSVAALCMLVVDGILEAVNILSTFLENTTNGKDEVRMNTVFKATKSALKALILHDEDLLIKAEIKILEAPIMPEEDQKLLLRLIEHIRSKISVKVFHKW